ncbi:MAG: hypothetical protein H0X66_05860 [Verrucomicrobia bacterium]|nr:hypothetical protein [Verrucomicrobiota bacterium]
MDLTKLQDKLIAAARSRPPGDQVPYAFEKRVMANLRQPLADAWSSWGSALWRAAFSCVVAMLLVMAWSQASTRTSADLSQAFEKTVLAAADHFDEDLQ